jgi:hypothetical protein
MTAAQSKAVAPAAAGEAAPHFDFERLTPEVGWMMIGVGVLGVILPGLPGAPFFLVGGAVLVPGGKRRIARWMEDRPGPIRRRSLKIIGRFMDDLDARYPRRA